MTNHFFRPIPPKSWQVRILSSVKWVKASILLHVSEKRTCIRHVSVKVVEGHPLCYLKLQIVFLCVSAWLAARYRTEFQYLPLFQPSLEEPVLFSFQTGSCYKLSTAALNFVMSCVSNLLRSPQKIVLAVSDVICSFCGPPIPGLFAVEIAQKHHASLK